MNENTLLLIVIGLTIAVIFALVLNRYFRARWGNKEVEVGNKDAHSSSMRMEATGPKSKIERALQHNETGAEDMEMKAEQGGQVIDAEQRAAKRESEK